MAEVKSGLQSGMQSPAAASSEQRGGATEGGEQLDSALPTQHVQFIVCVWKPWLEVPEVEADAKFPQRFCVGPENARL